MMDVSLVSSERIDFSKYTGESYDRSFQNVMVGVAKITAKLGQDRTETPSMLEKSLAKSCSLLDRALDANESREVSLVAALFFCSPSASLPSLVRFGNKVGEDNFFTRLERACGGFGNLTFQMELILRGPEHVDNMKLEATGLVVETHESLTIAEGGMANIIFHKFHITEDVFKKTWKKLSKVSGELTLRLKLNDAAYQSLQMDNLEDTLCTNRAIRADNGSTDAVIVAGDGAQVRCHKLFLTAHSAVFKAMFESSMKEGITSTVELPDMTEAGVQALLDYLYCWDMKAICQNASVALEVLLAADKYNIPRLGASLQELMLMKENDWFPIPVAIQLFRFSSNMRALAAEGEGQDSGKIFKSLEAKSVAVLKSKSAEELNECPEYQLLFEDPKMGKEFCTYFAIYPGNN